MWIALGGVSIVVAILAFTMLAIWVTADVDPLDRGDDDDEESG